MNKRKYLGYTKDQLKEFVSKHESRSSIDNISSLYYYIDLMGWDREEIMSVLPRKNRNIFEGYTKEMIIEYVKQYDLITKIPHHKTLCTYIKNMGWDRNEIMSNVPRRKIKPTRRTLEDIQQIASQYDSMAELRLHHPNIERLIYDHNYRQYLTFKNEPQEMTETECFIIALKYNTRSEFLRNDNSYYMKSRNKKWLDNYIWMPNPHLTPTEEMCYNAAKHCKTAEQFRLKYPVEYYHANCKGYMKTYDWFLYKIAVCDNDDKCYMIYAYFDEYNKCVYIGLTKNLGRRKSAHKNNISSAVNKHFSSINKEIPQPVVLEKGLTAMEATEREGYWLDFYVNKGYKKLNRCKTGSTGCYNIKKAYELSVQNGLTYDERFPPSEYKKCCEPYVKDLIIQSVDYKNIDDLRNRNEKLYNKLLTEDVIKYIPWLRD